MAGLELAVDEYPLSCFLIDYYSLYVPAAVQSLRYLPRVPCTCAIAISE